MLISGLLEGCVTAVTNRQNARYSHSVATRMEKYRVCMHGCHMVKDSGRNRNLAVRQFMVLGAKRPDGRSAHVCALSSTTGQRPWSCPGVQVSSPVSVKCHVTEQPRDFW